MVNDPGFLFFDSDIKLTFKVNASQLKSESMEFPGGPVVGTRSLYC